MKKTSTVLCGLFSGLLVLAAGTHDARAAVILYDGFNRPTSFTSLNVAGFGVFDISIDHSSNTFNEQYGLGDPPVPSPGGLSWGNEALALAVAAQMAIEMNLDATPIPTTLTRIYFPVTQISPGSGGSVNHADLRITGSTWNSLLNSGIPRTGDGFASWGTIVPEPSRALLGLVGIAAIGLRRRRS